MNASGSAVSPSDEQLLSVQIVGPGDVRAQVELGLLRLGKKARLIRGGKLLFGSWFAALGSAFLPGFHFVLVPAFLLAGPILFFVGYGQKERLVGGEIPCPACAAQVPLKSQSASWPLLLPCNACGEGLELGPL